MTKSVQSATRRLGRKLASLAGLLALLIPTATGAILQGEAPEGQTEKVVGGAPAASWNVEEPRVRVPAATPLRRRPDATSPILERIDAEVELMELERRGAWRRVAYDGLTGWIRLGEAPAAVAPPQPVAGVDRGDRNEPGFDLEGLASYPLGPWALSTDLDDGELLSSFDRLADEVVGMFRDRYGLTPPVHAERLPEPIIDDGRVFAIDEASVLSVLDPGFPAESGRLVLLSERWMGRSDRALRTALVHELCHLLTRQTFGTNAPPWLEEAVADDLVFTLGEDRTEVHRKRVHIHAGEYWSAVESLVDALEGGALPPLARLTALSWSEMVDREGWQLRYAHAALLVGFLVDADRGRWQEGFGSYLGALSSSGNGAHSSLTEALGTDWETLDRSFRRWLRSRDELTHQELRIE